MNNILKEDQSSSSIDDYKSLQNIIWHILDTCHIYVLLIDQDLKIKLINKTLVNDLGFENSQDVIGKDWIDFLPLEIQESLRIAYSKFLSYSDERYRELTNEILTRTGNILVKWFNISFKNMVLGFGLIHLNEENIVSEQAIRSYYFDVIEKDKNMITALRAGLSFGDTNE